MNGENLATPGVQGLPRVALRAMDGARSEVYLHGAHVTSWMPAGGQERLYLSELAEFRPGAAIRGGIPVIFPQFSDRGTLPRHGFARITSWDLVEATETQDGVASARFRLRDSAATQTIWPGQFLAELGVRIAGQRLDVTLAVSNLGQASFSFTAALHTYLAVEEVSQVSVEGLAGVRFEDQAAGNVEGRQTEPRLAIAGEVDRIYYDAPACVTVHSPPAVTEVWKQGFTDVVVWNPGAEKGSAISDMRLQDYQRMLCVEAAVIGRPVTLEPGQQWTGTQWLVARS